MDDKSIDISKNRVLAIWGVSLSQLIAFSDCFLPDISCRRKAFALMIRLFSRKKITPPSVYLNGWLNGGNGCFFFLLLHFNVLMQPMKAMKHSILSTYIDTHRIVLTMYVVWKSSLRETGS